MHPSIVYTYYPYMPHAPTPPARLLHIILDRIDREERTRVLRTRMTRSAFACIATAALMAVAGWSVSATMTASGFSEFLSLFVSDTAIVLAHWQSFLWMLLESLPTIPIALFLTTMSAFLLTLRALARRVRFLTLPTSLHGY